MSNTVTNISYANTFGEWMVATNALINENNVLGSGDYTKNSGTIYLNETTQNSLQANGTVIVQKELRVQGVGSSATIDRNLSVGGQVYFTNSALGLTHTGQANLNGLVLVQGSGIGISVSNSAYIGGNTTIRYNTVTNNLQANSSVNTQSLSVTGSSYTDYLYSNTQTTTTSLSVTYDAIISGVNILPYSSAAFLKANAAYGSQNTTGTYANSAFEFANSAGSYANSAFIKANSAYDSQNTTGTYANSAFGVANSAALYANGAFRQANGAFIHANSSFTQANAVYVLANNIVNGAQTISTLTLTGANLIALSARADFNSVFTSKLSVDGDFVINGATVYNSPSFILSSTSQNQTIYIGSYRTANGAANGVVANSYIRFNETNKFWEINDVNNSDIATTYSAILTANTISDNSISTSTSTVPTSRLVTGLFTQANSAYASQNTTGTYANSAFLRANSAYASQNTTGTYANSAYNQANTATTNAATADSKAVTAGSYANSAFAFANSAGSYANSAFIKANAAYGLANTFANTFVGTTGSVSQSSGVISFSSNNGVTVVATTANNLAVSTSQDLRTTASPTFAGLTLTSPLALAQGGTGATSAAAALTSLLPTGTTAGYVLTTGGPGNFYWAAASGGGGGATPGTTINSTRLSYTATANGQQTFTTPTFTSGTQLRAYIDGVRQFESEYSANISNSTISFTTAPGSGQSILIEVDGYYVNPYYANNIAFTINSNISPTANTIQLAVDGLTTKLTTYYANLTGGSTFTGDIRGVTMQAGTSNTSFATTAYVQNLANSSGTLTTSITGNAGTVTNGVYTSGSYANPSWITSLAGAKITGLATSATTDTTNAANISSGILAVARGGTGANTSTGTGSVVLSNSPTFTGTPTLPSGTIATTQSTTDNSTKVATTAFVQAVAQVLFPVGAIYTATVSTNPATLLGFGTWTAFGAGQVLVGAGTGGGATYTAGATGGSKDAIVVSHTHTATVTDPGHNHTYLRPSTTLPQSGSSTNCFVPANITSTTSTQTTGITVGISTTGSSGTDANMPPYVVVYMWQRTA